jgi:hypothetical protein
MALESFFEYPIQLIWGTNSPVTVSAAYVTGLPLNDLLYGPVVVLVKSTGALPGGMYVYNNSTNRWLYALESSYVDYGVIIGYNIVVYYNYTQTQTNFPAGAIVFKQGYPANPPQIDGIAACTYAVMTPASNTDLQPASTTTLGGVKVPTSGNLVVDSTGNLSVPLATNSIAGVVEIAPDGGLIVNGSGAISLAPGTGAFDFNQEIFVDPNGSNLDGTGTIGSPYATITYAYSKVTGSGAKILVSPGTYTENLVLGTNPVTITGTMAANGQSLTQLNGYIQIYGAAPVLIQDLAVVYVGVNAQLQVLGLTGTAPTHVRNVALAGQSSQQAIQTDSTQGTWTTGLYLENMSIPAGSITFAAGTVTATMAAEPSASIITVSGATVDFKYINSANEIVHTDGTLFLRHVDQVGTSTAAPAIVSSAAAGTSGNNFLWLGYVNTWFTVSTTGSTQQSYVNKSGACSYVVQGLTRNLAKDTWTGTQILAADISDLDELVTHTGVNYTGAAGTSLNTHITGIDNKLGTLVQSVPNASSGQTGAVSLVNNTTPSAPVVSQLVPGTNVSFAQGSGYVTVNVTATTTLSSVGGGTPVVYSTSGVVKTVAAGTNIVINDNGSGLLTFNSTASAITTTVNTFSGTVTIATGAGLGVTNNSGTITLANNGVLSLSTATGSGGYSPVYAASGVLKYLVAGTGMAIADNGSGVLTFTSNAAATLTSQGTGTSLVYNTNGILKTLTAGTNLSITDDGAGNLTINYATSTGETLLTSVSNATNSSGQPLVSNSGGTNGVAVVRQLVAGTNIALSQSADGTAVIIGSTGGVSTVNGLNFAVTIASGAGIGVSTAGQTITVANTGLTAIQANNTTDSGAVSLVAATTGTTANVMQLVPGTGITITSDGTAVTISAVSGFGTVTSVNSVDPVSGNVTLTASSVGAIPITGTGAGAVSGPINMNGNAIQNIPDATANGMPLSFTQLNDGSIYIDQGVI